MRSLKAVGSFTSKYIGKDTDLGRGEQDRIGRNLLTLYGLEHPKSCCEKPILSNYAVPRNLQVNNVIPVSNFTTQI